MECINCYYYERCSHFAREMLKAIENQDYKKQPCGGYLARVDIKDSKPRGQVGFKKKRQ